MCAPLLIVGAGLAVASAAAAAQQKSAQNDAISTARNTYNSDYSNFMSAEQKRQDAFNAQKDATLQDSIQNASQPNQDAQVQKKATDLSGAYTTAGQTALPSDTQTGLSAANPNNSVANALIGASTAASNAKTKSYIDQQGAAKAGIDAYQSQNLANGIFNTQQGNLLNITNNEQQGSANTLQTQLGLENDILQDNLAKAQGAGALAGMLSSVFGAAGGVASSAAGMTGGAKAASAAPSFFNTASSAPTSNYRYTTNPSAGSGWVF